MQQQVPGFAIFDTGISVHPKFPCLSVTPDGKVFDSSSRSKFGLLEIKCLIQNEGIHLIKHHQIQAFTLKKAELIFFLRKPISIRLKYKGSWPSLGYHGVIFV